MTVLLAIAWVHTPARGDPASFDAQAVSATPSTQPGIGAIPAEILKVAEDVRTRPLAERISAISAALLGRPYVSDPMGEGAGADADPLARYDAFDCLTYVEEVVALAVAGDPSHAAEVRTALRYDAGPTDYVHRRHFMELQWIPGTVRDGWLRETTSEYGQVVVLEKEVTAATWNAWAPRKKFAHTDAELPVGPMRLEVLPLDEASKAAATIRPGSILLTVRKDKPGVPIWITHVSLVVTDAAGKTVMRHATKIGAGGTRDHGVGWYVEHLRTYDNWPVLGIAVLEPIEQGPRMAALAR